MSETQTAAAIEVPVADSAPVSSPPEALEASSSNAAAPQVEEVKAPAAEPPAVVEIPDGHPVAIPSSSEPPSVNSQESKSSEVAPSQNEDPAAAALLSAFEFQGCNKPNSAPPTRITTDAELLSLLSIPDSNGDSPFECALAAGEEESARVIVDALGDAALAQPDLKGWLPVQQVVRYGRLTLLKYLIEEKGQDPSCAYDGDPLVILAARHQHLHILMYLRAKGANLLATCSKTPALTTIAHAAIEKNGIHILRWLADPNASQDASHYLLPAKQTCE